VRVAWTRACCEMLRGCVLAYNHRFSFADCQNTATCHTPCANHAYAKHFHVLDALSGESYVLVHAALQDLLYWPQDARERRTVNRQDRQLPFGLYSCLT
jgi:hypothetical protein